MSTITPLAPSFQKNIPRHRQPEPEIEEPQYVQQQYYQQMPNQNQMVLTQQSQPIQDVTKPDESQNKIIYIVVAIILILIVAIFIWVYFSKDKTEEDNAVMEAKQQQIKEDNAKMMVQKNMQNEMQKREVEARRRKEIEDHNAALDMQRRAQLAKLAELEKTKAALKQSNEMLAKNMNVEQPQNNAESEQAKLQEQILKQIQENRVPVVAKVEAPVKEEPSSSPKIEEITDETSTSVAEPNLTQSFEDVGTEKPKTKSKTKK